MDFNEINLDKVEYQDLTKLAVNRNYSILFYILNTRKDKFLEYKNILFIWSCHNNQYKLAVFLVIYYGVDPMWQDCLGIRLAGENNNIKIFIWLYANKYYNNNIIKDLFLISSSSGYIEIAKILADDFRNSGDIMSKGFQNSCSNGHLSIAKYLFKNFHNQIDHNAYSDLAFRMSCINGHLSTAQWIFELGNVNTHADFDSAFSISCVNGHIDVAKWVYSLGGVDIHVDNDIVFKTLLLPEEYQIGCWLISLGIIPEKGHALRKEYQSYCRNRIESIFIMAVTLIRAQRCIKNYLYHPDSKFIQRVKINFENMVKYHILEINNTT